MGWFKRKVAEALSEKWVLVNTYVDTGQEWGKPQVFSSKEAAYASAKEYYDWQVKNFGSPLYPMFGRKVRRWQEGDDRPAEADERFLSEHIQIEE